MVLESVETKASELEQSCWSVIDARGIAAAHLTYTEALALVQTLKTEQVFGLCIVTDEAAERITK